MNFPNGRLKYLAERNQISHCPHVSYGENIYLVRKSMQPEEIVHEWYKEIENYDFYEARYTPITGHFTQIVWKDCTEIGVGIAKR